MALWDIAHEGNGALGTGAFRLTQGGTTPNAVRAQVLTYLNEADRTEGGDNCDGILRTGSQDLML